MIKKIPCPNFLKIKIVTYYFVGVYVETFDINLFDADDKPKWNPIYFIKAMNHPCFAMLDETRFYQVIGLSSVEWGLAINAGSKMLLTCS